MRLEDYIKGLLLEAIKKSKGLSDLKQIPAIDLACPKNKQFGDFSTNLAMVLAKMLNRAPQEIAQEIIRALDKQRTAAGIAEKIERIEVKGAGFINFFLTKSSLHEVLREIIRKRNNFGRSNLGQAERVHIEFVSANPTGPLNVAHARQAAFGDTLARVFEFSGYKVHREYYLNDQGTQIDLLGDSLCAKYRQLLGISAEFPSSGYRGRYIDDLAGILVRRYGGRLARGKKLKRDFFCRFATGKILQEIKKDLIGFGVRYKSWFSQKSLSQSGKIKKVLAHLEKKGFLYQKEGAWWLATTRFGDDKDRVVIKSDSTFTYIAPDIAYHQSKFKRNFKRMINIWGPDHHGYIGRLKAAVIALGYDAGYVSFIIVQLVSLSSADKVIPMSTRLGQYVSLSDIVGAVGKDVARFFFLMRKRDAHLHFDLELAKKQSMENPVYYIQYAHARCLNILKYGRGNKRPKSSGMNLLLPLLDKPEELRLIQALHRFPGIVEQCVNNLEPHKLTTYLQDLAKCLHRYYERHRVVCRDRNLSCARLILVEATRIVLSSGLRLLAISVPEKM